MFKNFSILLGAILLASCASNSPDCVGLQSRNLDSAVDAAQTALINGCHAHFDRYYDDLLSIGEGDPRPENKRAFSEFLVWSSDRGLLSKRQAQDYYNRYFNVKFMAMEGDYNNCAQTCPRKTRVLTAMEAELTDKERGLVKVSQDPASYYRADRLFQETELVLEATCTACASR